ncbi:hypothetical protein D3Z29_03795 [Rodentibacter pneumotropicus]|nr:hypothetical protein [Rodentibacter pneumotropicus]THA05572.1 hypothetical protein D3M73_06775 [Rodentibacter pneumotropicus]THA11700.1 hypothetical protein D3M81_07905 [Rodentibacter pneumotropicus]THA17522.1 hypothetical protein D3M82_00270 [Rodentibacter pneumotropicus]
MYSVLGVNARGKLLNKKEKETYYDEFITSYSSDLNPNKKVTFFPQIIDDPKDQNNKIPYFITHSAMREWEYEWEGMWDRNKVFPLIYEKSYKEWIIDRITENSKFGRY